MDESFEPKSIDEIIDTLVLELFSYENDELIDIRNSAKLTDNPEKISGLRNGYREVAQGLTNDPKDQLGIMVASAMMLRYSGDIDGCKRELKDAEEFAYQFGWTEIGVEIKSMRIVME